MWTTDCRGWFLPSTPLTTPLTHPLTPHTTIGTPQKHMKLQKITIFYHTPTSSDLYLIIHVHWFLRNCALPIWVPDLCSFRVLDCSTNVSGTQLPPSLFKILEKPFPWIYHAQNLRKYKIYFDKCFITFHGHVLFWCVSVSFRFRICHCCYVLSNLRENVPRNCVVYLHVWLAVRGSDFC
jgi:hypothetical protein